MAARIAYADVQVGTEIPARDITVQRIDLLRYCGACSDYTMTHWNERVAKSVGLPDVIAHGTYTIAAAVRVLTDWVGDPSALLEYSVRRFTRPVVVPDDDIGATVRISGAVERLLDGNRAQIRLRARFEGLEVMSGARAVVRLA
ncbi:MaoC/PaaZ C-terminal domain-containing protein [Streptomyces pseudovenezuelae]|uniref:MaoC/PaaZ C-terminal domain-containing protein n=1 Tax=Streptomyces pseudovenezuelae TaxID=67350 RepID=UPI0034A50E98